MKRAAALLALAVVAAACAHAPLNAPLAKADIATGYRYANLSLPRQDGLFVILTFSGGGSRAAGFAYGVLRELEKVTLRDGSRLTDRIDVISSVSGGSFTAMYFGLHGAAGLDDFQHRFLDRNVEGMLFRTAFLSPRNLVRLASPNFSRIDVAAEVYDKILFDNLTYADLQKAQSASGTRRPLIVANSTELDLGSRFEWTQDQFDPICSDLSKTHVARAVAASSAFPVLLTPVVLRNYEGGCGYTAPSWVRNARGDMAVNAARQRNAVELEAYLDPQRGWLHLMDGGIADNIGLRGPLHAMTSGDTLQMDDPSRQRTGFTIQGELNRRTIKQLLIVTVDAGTESLLNFDRKERSPGLPAILGTISDTPLSNYSFDTVEMLTRVVTDYEVRQRQAADCVAAVKSQCPDATLPGANVPPVAFYPVVLGFSAVPDAQFRKQLNDIGTNFSLKPGQLELLERAAKELLAASPAYQQFLNDVGAR
jgi:NTE family protein